jgi:hypothetical protein
MRTAILLTVVIASACKGEGRAPQASAPGAARPGSNAAAAIAGTWHRVLLTMDDNANDQLDAEERKPSGMDYGFTVLVIRPDGTCDLENKKAKGKGTCTPVERDGKTYIEIDPLPEHMEHLDSWQHRVLSRSDRELVLKDPTGPKGTIYAFERR